MRGKRFEPRVLDVNDGDELEKEFSRIGVDWGGRAIMAAKGHVHIIKFKQLPSFCANILKQEMLSLGGDVAVSRGSITGSVPKTDCLVMGTQAQLAAWINKLKKQPFGLDDLARSAKNVLKAQGSRVSILNMEGRRVRLGKKTLIMGVVNVTPDSFSGDGLYGKRAEEILQVIDRMVAEGADLIDIGAESTRPGSKRVTAKAELKRIIDLLKMMEKRVRVPVSVDTVKSEVAWAALDRGVSIINDVSALRYDPKMAKLVSRYQANVVLMHMKGTPVSMQRGPVYSDVMEEIYDFLVQAKARALDSGIVEEKIILDPGVGFGKDLGHNLEILKRLSELKGLGRPLLVGLSRKSFIGRILGPGTQERVWGTVGACALAACHGADILRVHDVKQVKQAVSVIDAAVKNGKIYF